MTPAYASWASSPEEAILYASEKAEDQPIVALISALRSGHLHLEPTATSGLYRRWWYALETLAVPERAPEKDKLQLKSSYAARWQRTFAAGFTDGRSGIVKRMPEVYLGITAGSDISIQVAPTFTCEPAPVVYLRLARAYRTLNHDLETAFGSERWKATVDAQGNSLSATLTERSTRLFGIAIQCYREIGYPALLSDEERTIDQKNAASLGIAWCDGSALDPDVTADARHLVTLIADDTRLRCPAIAGVRLEPVTYSWVEKPSIGGDFVATFVPSHYWLTTPVFLTATLDKIPTPEEFRRDCDRYSTVAELSAAFHDTPMQPMREPSNWWQGCLMIALTLLVILKNAVENQFTAKTPRAQRTCSKDNAHLFGEDTDQTIFYSKP